MSVGVGGCWRGENLGRVTRERQVGWVVGGLSE